MLWIKNGRLVDPKSQTDKVCDICIERDRIAGITVSYTHLDVYKRQVQ